MEQESKDAKTQPYSFRNLALWQRAQELALGVIKMTETLPRNQAAKTLARQIVASSGSIPANIAEGHGRYSVAAYRNHLSIARGSAAETDTWLDLLRRAGYIEPARAEELHRECLVLLAGLTRQMKSLEAKLRHDRLSALREDPTEYLDDQIPDESLLE